MAFITPCFVRVEDAAERKELVKWAHGIGNDLCVDYGELVISNFLSSTLLNCDADVKLFKALASMNDDNDREQWFVVKKNISDCYDIDDIIYHKGDMFFNESGEPLVEKNFRKATAEEIVEYFKKIEKCKR